MCSSSDLATTSKFCAGYSIVGTLFMLMVALMLTHQPFFMGGIDDVTVARGNAYKAMCMFVFTFILSVAYIVKDVATTPEEGDEPRRRRSGNNYEGIPQGTGGPAVLAEYARNLELPESVESGVFT